MIFEKLTIEDRELINNFRKDSEVSCQIYDSDMDFPTLYAWSCCDNSAICQVDNAIIGRYNACIGEGFFTPYVRTKEDIIPTLKLIEQYCDEHNMRFAVTRVNEFVANVAKEIGHYNIQEEFDQDEYLYDPNDLISLAGKKFNSKRNFLNGFINSYKYDLLPYSSEYRQLVWDLLHCWASDVNSNEFKCELSAIFCILDNIERLNCMCECLFVEGKLIAFAVGYVSFNNIGVVMFEKADTLYRGSYVAINNMFASKHFAQVKYINRQEDMGIEGLRKAKLSYHPVLMNRKYSITK